METVSPIVVVHEVFAVAGTLGLAVTVELTEELLVVTTAGPVVGTVIEEPFDEATRVLTLELAVGLLVGAWPVPNLVEELVVLLAEIDGLIACGVLDMVAGVDGVEAEEEEDDVDATVTDGLTTAVVLTKASPTGGACQYMIRSSRSKLTTTLSSRGHPRTNGPLSSSMAELQHMFFSFDHKISLVDCESMTADGEACGGSCSITRHRPAS